MKKIIILRGNSGSGKTTVARALQKKFGYNTMMISQDEIRRNILWVKDGVDTKALPLMIELMKYGYEHCDVVILEVVSKRNSHVNGYMISIQLSPIVDQVYKMYHVQNRRQKYIFHSVIENITKRKSWRRNAFM